MDCNALDKLPACGPCADQPSGLNAFGTVTCWNCEATGHPARLCPQPMKPEIAEHIKAKGKGKDGGGKHGGSKGGYGGYGKSKGKGKGGYGKGGKAKGYGKTGLNAFNASAEWYDVQAWSQWEGDQ